jgi:hypothetical protein
MSKNKKDDAKAFDTPNYEALTTIEDVELEIERHKNILVGKDKTEYQIKENKREFVSATNEQLKELKEEREHEICVLSALDDRRRQIFAGSNIIPLPSKN